MAKSDYDDFFITSEDDTIKQIEWARRVYKMIEQYCTDRIDRGQYWNEQFREWFKQVNNGRSRT